MNQEENQFVSTILRAQRKGGYAQLMEEDILALPKEYQDWVERNVAAQEQEVKKQLEQVPEDKREEYLQGLRYLDEDLKQQFLKRDDGKETIELVKRILNLPGMERLAANHFINMAKRAVEEKRRAASRQTGNPGKPSPAVEHQ